MKNTRPKAVLILEATLFNIKWILPAFYLGLVFVLGLYGVSYLINLGNLIQHYQSIEDMKIVVLDMVDVVMVANLVKMIIVGSYHSFITKEHGRENGNMSSGLLKIKIASSVVVVGMINLLRTFVSHTEHQVTWTTIEPQLAIFAAFLIGTLVLSFIEYLHLLSEHLESTEKDEHVA